MKKHKKILSMMLSCAVVFSSLSFATFAEDKSANWKFSAFGSNTGADKNPAPTQDADGSITLLAKGGKIASGDEGMSFYFQELPQDTNFELSATATVKGFNQDTSISTPNQKSFGIMLRDEVGENSDSGKFTSNYVAVGALDTVIKSFYKSTDLKTEEQKQTKGSSFNLNVPVENEVYELSIKKSGDIYQLTSNGKKETIALEGAFTDNLFAGLYVARDAEVSFSNVNIAVDKEKVEALEVDATQMKKTYLLDEKIDTSQLKVKAIYSRNVKKDLGKDDYVITGFDSTTKGKNTIKIHYNGAVETLDLTIEPLTVTSMDIKYLPAKTDYYIGDVFDPLGLVVEATYNDGYRVQEIEEELYAFYVKGKKIDAEYVFASSGNQTITIGSLETPKTTKDLKLVVSKAELEGLEISKVPTKTAYFIGDTLDLDGMKLYAKYNDNTKVHLMKQEYVATGFDATTAGEKVITISHKGQTIELPIQVKEKEVVGLQVSEYPKTTYAINEDLDFKNLVISKVYDNGDVEQLDASLYSLDTSSYKKAAEGRYSIKVLPTDSDLKGIEIPVTVRKVVEPKWESIVFGQSINKSKNYVELVGDKVRLVAEEGAGKLTGDHDGITFYYTELDANKDNFVLSANIKVEEYAKKPHDGQESFGIMARDYIGDHLNSSVIASNIAAIGGYSGGTKDDNGTQLFVRTGVESPDGTGSKGINAVMLKNERPAADNTYPAKDYRLTLAKTNSGFTGSINNGDQELIYTPEILKAQNGKMYVGFYVARLATIEVSDIELTVSHIATDAAKVLPPAKPVEPSLEIVSPKTSSKTEYDVMVSSNVNGVVIIKKGNETIANEEVVKAGKIVKVPTRISNKAKTNFTVIFLPEDTQYLTSYDKVVENFQVDMQTFRGKSDIYVSPEGKKTNEGTKENPIDLDTAIKFIQNGQKIILLEGTYTRSTPLNIEKYNDGKVSAKKYLWADAGAKVVIDFNKKSEGGLLSGNFWHIKGIDFTNSAGNTKGFTVGGNHNIIELCNFYNNGDTGMQISRTDKSDKMTDWPSYNLILNCTSYDNSDPSQNNADGFAAKLTSGVGNVFDGCIAHNNVDDGWDLYTKSGLGAIGAIHIKNSITYGNGRLTDGKDTKGDGNGFKLGGEGIHVAHIIENSISFNNEAFGITSNSNPGLIAKNNISFNNVGGNIDFRTYDHIKPDFKVDGVLSYQNKYNAKDVYQEDTDSDTNFIFDGKESKNTSGVTLTDANFKSLDIKVPYERDEKGNIIWGDFLQLVEQD